MATGSYRLKVKAYQRPGGSGDIVPAYVNADDKKDGTFGTTSEIYVNGGNEGKQAIKNAASPMITTKVGPGNESEVEVSGTKYYIPNDMVSAVAYFAAGHYENTTDIIATTTSITFGFRSTANHVGSDWTIFDDFRLYYTGQLDLSVFQASLNTKVIEAGEVKTELTGKVPASVLTALQDVVDANDNDDSAFDDEEQFTTAIANINAAITAAQSAEAPYTAWKNMKAKAEVLVAVENDNDEANGTLSTAISTQNGAVENATAGDDIEAATSALKTAMVTYCGAANPVGDGAKFDMTFMLTNPDVTSFWTGDWSVKPAGWFNDQTDGNFQVMSNDEMGPGGEVFMEYWQDNPKTSGFVLYQKVTLTEGTYKMTGRVGLLQNVGGTTANMTFSANDVDGSQIAVGTLADQTVDFVNKSEQEVKIGIKAHEGNCYRWIGINKIKLFKVPAVTVTIDEGVDYTPESVAGQVTLKRTLAIDKWNTFVVPFQITNEELKAAFGEEVAVAEYSEESVDANNATVTFTLMGTPAIAPNKPVLLKPRVVNDGNTYVFENRTIATGEAKVAGTNFDFVGSYGSKTTIDEGDYYLKENKLWKSQGFDSYILGTRAYIKATTAGARITSLVIDGEETTGIMNVEQGTVSFGKVYNMQGQQVKNAQKGIFIQNGKKFVIK